MMLNAPICKDAYPPEAILDRTVCRPFRPLAGIRRIVTGAVGFALAAVLNKIGIGPWVIVAVLAAAMLLPIAHKQGVATKIGAHGIGGDHTGGHRP